ELAREDGVSVDAFSAFVQTLSRASWLPRPSARIKSRPVYRQVSTASAGLADVEAGFLGLLGAAFKRLELLLGLGTRQQRQGLGVTDRSGETFSLGQIQLMPGSVELSGAAVAISGLASTTCKNQNKQWQTDKGFHSGVTSRVNRECAALTVRGSKSAAARGYARFFHLVISQQTIPYSRLGEDEPRSGWIICQLLPQMPHHDTQIVTVFGVRRPPDILEQLLLGNDPPGMPRQLCQHRVFLAGQRHFLTVEQHTPIGEVDGERPELKRRIGLFTARRLPEQRPDSSQKLLNAKRFGHVVVGAGVQCLNFLCLTGAHRKHQHRHRRPLAKLAQHLLTVHVRQPKVEHQQIRFVQRRLSQPLRACGGFQHLVALRHQTDAQKLANLRLVVDDQNGGRLAQADSSSSTSGCACSGRNRVMRVPSPSMPSSTVSRPPCAPIIP
ncbi:LysR family transcriptional regulator, partial [Pseudomonas syringae pv. pisi]